MPVFTVPRARAFDLFAAVTPPSLPAVSCDNQELVGEELFGLLDRQPPDMQSPDSYLTGSFLGYPIFIPRARHCFDLLDFESGTKEEFLNLTAGEEPDMIAVEETGRLVSPIACKQAAQHSMVPDVWDAGY
jgi:hypothetical protein